MPPRFLVTLQVLVVVGSLSLGCASGPAVISSTPENIAVEFPKDGTVKSASDLAQKECEKYGKTADFESVDATASPETRVAKFNCVASTGSAN